MGLRARCPASRTGVPSQGSAGESLWSIRKKEGRKFRDLCSAGCCELPPAGWRWTQNTSEMVQRHSNAFLQSSASSKVGDGEQSTLMESGSVSKQALSHTHSTLAGGPFLQLSGAGSEKKAPSYLHAGKKMTETSA